MPGFLDLPVGFLVREVGFERSTVDATRFDLA